MRYLTKTLLTACLAAAFVSLVLAQQPGRGFGPQLTESAFLLQTSVQDELKLTDAQKDKLKKISGDLKTALDEAGKSKDFQAFAKAQETANTSADEVAKDLKAEQKKRLVQIYVQYLTGPNNKAGNGFVVFTNEDVQKELKLTDKQKDAIKTLVADTDKNVREIRESAKGDKDKQKEAREKITGLYKDVTDKIQASLTDDQKKAWTALPGPKFEGEITFPGARGGKEKN
jgi:Spy/CpxP family protein refolding chaperone